MTSDGVLCILDLNGISPYILYNKRQPKIIGRGDFLKTFAVFYSQLRLLMKRVLGDDMVEENVLPCPELLKLLKANEWHAKFVHLNCTESRVSGLVIPYVFRLDSKYKVLNLLLCSCKVY